MCGNLFDVVPTCVVALVGFAFGFKGTSLVAQMVKRLPTMRETHVQSLGQEDLLEKKMAPHSSILAWKIPWTEESEAIVHGVTKSQTWLSDFTHLASNLKRKSLSTLISRHLLPMFSLGNVMVSGLTFKSLIHFELNLGYCVRLWVWCSGQNALLNLVC